jgi:restriction endonuclease S subunit
MKATSIQYSELEDRFDADYYDPEFVDVERTLANYDKNIKPLSELTEIITDGAHQTPTYVDSGVTFLSSGNIREFQVDLTDTKYISESAHEDLKRTQVQSGDVLVAKSGRIGIAAVAPPGIGRCNLYEGVALVRPKDELNPHFLSAFLNSKYGQSQIMRSKKGISQPHLHLEEIEEILVPIPEESMQEYISEMLSDSREYWKKSQKKLRESVQELEDILGLSSTYNKSLTYSIGYSELSETTRLDSEHYQPKYSQILEDIIECGYDLKTISDIEDFEMSNERVDPSKNPSKEIDYVTIGDIDSQTGEISDSEVLLGHEAPSRARMKIQTGDVLVPYLRDSAESVALVLDDHDGYIATTGFYVIRGKTSLPKYVFALMRSRVVQFQMDQKESGVRLTSVNKTDFKRIEVPVVGKEEQQEIASIVEQSLDQREKSRVLVEKSKEEIGQLLVE